MFERYYVMFCFSAICSDRNSSRVVQRQSGNRLTEFLQLVLVLCVVRAVTTGVGGMAVKANV
jgi:hypothetical protein